MCLCGFLFPAASAPLAEPQVIENVVLRGGINHTGTGGFIFPQNKSTGTKSGVSLFQGICLHSCGTWLSMSLGQEEKVKSLEVSEYREGQVLFKDPVQITFFLMNLRLNQLEAVHLKIPFTAAPPLVFE